MADPATKEDLDELRDELRADMTTLRDEVRDGMSELRGELRADMTGLRDELRDEMRAMETRLVFQIGDAASRTANAVIERFSDMVTPLDDKASLALAEARAARLEVGELRSDFIRHAGDPEGH